MVRLIRCPKCKEEKSETEFYKSKGKIDKSRCKSCEKKRRRDYYECHIKEEKDYAINYRLTHGRDLTKERLWSKKRRDKIRLEVLIHYGGNPPKCSCCGETIIEFLTIDHIHGKGNKHREKIFGDKKRAGTNFYYWLKRNGFPEGFQVLCMNCNFAEAYRDGCPHRKGRYVK